MNLRETLKRYSSIEIELLLSEVIGKQRELLFMHPEHKLSEKQQTRLLNFVGRRIKGEPMAYILGYKDFMGLRFMVNRNVLIPRPETEELVRKVYQVCKVYKAGRPLKILDLGTGTGCIIISLAKGLRAKGLGLRCKLYASDISSATLKVANNNAKNQLNHSWYHTGVYHARGIKFIRSNLFQNINGQFGVIAANLPYVRKSAIRSLKLDYEPTIALTDGTNVFKIYERFFQQVGRHLAPNAVIFLEIDPTSKKFILEYQKKYLPNAEMEFHRDFSNLWRYAEINTR
jgi:release factor glutamine methyltransferase